MNILYTLQNEHGLQFDTHTTKIGTAENEQYVLLKIDGNIRMCTSMYIQEWLCVNH